MKMKYWIRTILAIVTLGIMASCGGETPDVGYSEVDLVQAQLAYELLTPEEQSMACDIAQTTEGEEKLIDAIMAPPDPMSEGQAVAFVEVLEGEC